MKRWLSWITLLVFASVPLWLNDPYLLNAFITTGIFIVAAMSLNLLLGYTGQLSLGHVAFFGIGAYTSALVSLGFDVEVDWRISRGSRAMAGVARFYHCCPVFRIVRLSRRKAVFPRSRRLFCDRDDQLRGGRSTGRVELGRTHPRSLALTSIPPMTLGLPGLGYFDFYSKQSNYYLVLAVIVISYVIIKRLVNSRVGRAMVALKENESLAVSVGIDVTRYLVLAAVVSAGIAGAAGSLYAHYLKIIDPDVFLFLYTVTMVIMVITGGKGTLAGPIVGGLIFGFIPVVARSFAAPEIQWILYGLFMILIVFVLPQGIVPAIEKWFGVNDEPKVAPTTEAKIQDAR